MFGQKTQDAEDSAENKMESGGYQEGDCSVRVEAIYDVTIQMTR